MNHRHVAERLESEGSVQITDQRSIPPHMLSLNRKESESYEERVRESAIVSLAQAFPREGEFDVTLCWHEAPGDGSGFPGGKTIAVRADIRKIHTLPKKRYVTTVTGRIVEADLPPNFQEMPDRMRGGRVGWYPMTRPVEIKVIHIFRINGQWHTSVDNWPTVGRKHDDRDTALSGTIDALIHALAPLAIGIVEIKGDREHG